jgi:hypothetical protein
VQSYLLHFAVFVFLVILGLALLALLPAVYCTYNGAAAQWLAGRLALSALTSQGIVGAALSLYCALVLGTLWSILGQLLV